MPLFGSEILVSFALALLRKNTIFLHGLGIWIRIIFIQATKQHHKGCHGATQLYSRTAHVQVVSLFSADGNYHVLHMYFRTLIHNRQNLWEWHVALFGTPQSTIFWVNQPSALRLMPVSTVSQLTNALALQTKLVMFYESETISYSVYSTLRKWFLYNTSHCRYWNKNHFLKEIDQ